MFSQHSLPVQEIQHRRAFNVSGSPVRVEIATQAGYAPRSTVVPPGEPIELPASYTTSVQLSKGRDPRPSVIEQLTGGKVLDESDPRAKDVAARYDAAQAEKAKKAK